MTTLAERLVAFFADSPSVHVVGGAVRDRLLGRPVHDFDLVVTGDALGQTRRLADALGGAYLVLDSRFGLARVLVGGDQVDVAREREGGLDADLRQRDFTVNAMAMPLSEWLNAQPTVIDPLDGCADLQARSVRATSENAFRQDPGRLLRAPRFAAQLGGQIEPQTDGWVRRDASLLRRASPERLRDELWRCLMLPGTAAIVQELDRLDLLGRLLPDVVAMQGVTQRPPHTLDVYEHSLLALDNTETLLGSLGLGQRMGDPTLEAALSPYQTDLRAHLIDELVLARPRWTLLKLAALLHDVGKPRTRTETGGLVHFYEHESVGAAIVEEIGVEFRLGSREIDWLTLVVRQHLRPLFLAQQQPPSRRSVYRYFRDTGEAAPDILLLSVSDNRAKGAVEVQPRADDRILDVMVDLLKLYYSEADAPVVRPPALVNGHDLMQLLGLPPGPRVGEILERLREAAATSEITTRDEALALARTMV